MKPCSFRYAAVFASLLTVSEGVLGGVVVVPLGGDTYRAAVSKTGQANCYDVADQTGSPPNPAVVACPGSGQDGDHRRGVAWPEPRFEDLQDGTIRDRLTGLIWIQNANCKGSTPPFSVPTDGLVTMQAAYEYVDNLNAGFIKGNCGDLGFADDWRVPNRFELESLLDLSEIEPALPAGHPFTHVQADRYWSSSYEAYYAPVLGVGWVVDFSAGEVSHNSWTLQPAYFWPVRGGVPQ